MQDYVKRDVSNVVTTVFAYSAWIINVVRMHRAQLGDALYARLHRLERKAQRSTEALSSAEVACSEGYEQSDAAWRKVRLVNHSAMQLIRAFEARPAESMKLFNRRDPEALAGQLMEYLRGFPAFGWAIAVELEALRDQAVRLQAAYEARVAERRSAQLKLSAASFELRSATFDARQALLANGIEVSLPTFRRAPSPKQAATPSKPPSPPAPPPPSIPASFSSNGTPIPV